MLKFGPPTGRLPRQVERPRLLAQDSRVEERFGFDGHTPGARLCRIVKKRSGFLISGWELEDWCNLETVQASVQCAQVVGKGARVCARERGGETLGTSKEHARNMLGTCLALFHCSRGPKVLLRARAYLSGAPRRIRGFAAPRSGQTP